MHRVVYLGNVRKVAESLLRMKSIELAGVVYEEPEDASDFAILYKKFNVPTFRVSSDEELRLALEEIQPLDLGIIANFGIILKGETIRMAKQGFLNAHPGLLPENPGRMPIEKSLSKGDAKSGLTLHEVTEAPDQGKVLDRIEISLQDLSSHELIFQRLYGLVPTLLDRHLSLILI